MALWDQLKSRLQGLTADTKVQVGKFQNKDFAKASMAMCALIAAADGTISAEERSRMVGFIASNDALSVFQPSELQQHFEFYASKLEKDFEFGKLESIATIGDQRRHHHRRRRRELRREREARRPGRLQRREHPAG